MAVTALAPLVGRLGIAGTKAFLKSPMGKKILDSLVGGGATAYGLDKLFFGEDVRETPEGYDIGPEEKTPPTLEELKERNVETFPGEAVPPFKLPGFNEGVTGIDELTTPTGFGEGFPETTLEDITSSGGFQKEDVPDMSIMNRRNNSKRRRKTIL